MDLADLVAAAVKRGDRSLPRAVVLGLFMLGGAAWFGVERWLAAPERGLIEVSVPRGDVAARERIVDEAVLVEVGLGLDWQLDPLIRDRIERSLGATTIRARGGELMAEAMAIDLPRRDPLVRARLAEHARRILPAPGAPSDVELATFAAAHAAQFMPPVVATFEYTSNAPDLVLGPRPTRTLQAIERALGAAAAKVIAEAPTGPNSPWVAIATGRVRVIARTTPTLPPLLAIRPQVLAAWRAARRPELERAALDQLRAGFDIIVSER